MTDILQRIANMLGDCAIGPMRTLKTDDLTRVLYDAHEEIERLRARETRLQKALQVIIDMYGETLRAGEIALAALGEEKKG